MKIKLKKFGNFLSSRQLGREAFLAFQPTLKSLSGKEKLEIDFEDIESCSPSWIDEFLTPLAKEYGKRLVLKKSDNISVVATLEFLEEINKMKFNISD